MPTRSSQNEEELIEKCLAILKPKIKSVVVKELEINRNAQAEEIMVLKTELAQIKESQQFISMQFEELKAENAKLIKCNKNLEKDYQKLRDEVEMLHDVQTDQFEHLDNLEQYGRRENLEFEGVPQVQNEDTTEVVIKIADKLNINLNENDISIAHRLPTKRPGKSNNSSTNLPTPAIIARFANRRIRNLIYSKRSAARKIPTTEFPVPGITRLFINENLTSYRKKLPWQTKQKMKENNYKYIWTKNGRIFIRKDDESNPIEIRRERDTWSL